MEYETLQGQKAKYLFLGSTVVEYHEIFASVKILTLLPWHFCDASAEGWQKFDGKEPCGRD